MLVINQNMELAQVKLLLSSGSDPNVRDEEGKTVLQLQISEGGKLGTIEAIKCLVERGADPSIKDKQGADFLSAVHNNNQLWEGTWKNAQQWNGKGICLWKDLNEEQWIFEGELRQGKPQGNVFMFRVSTNTITLKATFQDGQKVGSGILTENGKEYFVEFQDGVEVLEKRKRTFEGVRLMIVGCQDVGKTTFKKRLMGIGDEKANMKAYYQVLNEKKEHEMTHGIEIDKLVNKERGILFSIWDNAGHEEYHTGNSIFFSSQCVYLLLFDCSLPLENLLSKNKLLYWLYFLQQRNGKGTTCILIATKTDLLEKRLERKREALNQTLSEINAQIKKLVLTNGIEMKIHKFIVEGSNEEFLFYPLRNREMDAKKAGISSIFEVLSKEYDSVEHSISTNLKHKYVFERIEKLSRAASLRGEEEALVGPPVLIEQEQEKKKKKKKKKRSKLCSSESEVAPILPPKKELPADPFIEVSKLREDILSQAKSESEKEFAQNISENLEKILDDLHKLGVIVFIDHDILSKTIICDLKWFNKASFILYTKKNNQNTLSPNLYF